VSLFSGISMAFAAQKNSLTIRLNESQIGYLAYRFPELDPEDAIVELLEHDLIRTLRKADRKVEVLHLQGDPQPVETETEITLPVESENPIGDLQEYCQKKQVPMPSYSFEAVDTRLGRLSREKSKSGIMSRSASTPP
jgi:hypothetical protein